MKHMKMIMILFSVICIGCILLLNSCVIKKIQPESYETIDLVGPSDTPKGTIVINFPEDSFKSKNIDLPWAKEHTDVYSIFVYNADVIYEHSTEPVEAKALIVAVGTYKVLVLAGMNYNDQNNVVLLGSGMKENVAVLEDEVTTVTIVLRNITYSITYPAEVQCGVDYNVVVQGDFNVDVINTYGYKISVGLDEYQLNYNEITYDNCLWAGAFTLPAPLSPQTLQLKIIGYCNLVLNDQEYSIYEHLVNEYTYNWFMPFDEVVPRNETFIDFVDHPVDTGLIVNIIWEDEVVGVLSQFSVEVGLGGMIPGTAFNILITAQDALGNTVTAFSGGGHTVDIMDTTGTIAPTVSGVFTNGVRVEAVIITGTAVGDVIKVVVSGGVFGEDPSGESDEFDVNVGPSALDHFTFTVEPTDPPNPPSLIAGAGIVVRIEAQDLLGNLITEFIGTATITDLTGTISEGAPGGGDTTIQFVSGVYNDALNPTLFITSAQTSNRIEVFNSIGGIIGISAVFDVLP